jgi:hypothetical protein
MKQPLNRGDCAVFRSAIHRLVPKRLRRRAIGGVIQVPTGVDSVPRLSHGYVSYDPGWREPDGLLEAVNRHWPLPSSVDPAGFGRLHGAVADALLAHAASAGKKPYKFSERYDVAVRVWHKLNSREES